MTLLLDTHVFLWMLAEPERLSERARGLIIDGRNELLLSAASSWEIAIKCGLGRLVLPEPATVFVPTRIQSHGLIPLAVEHRHALAVSELPAHHRDPFDRLLIAQALDLGVAILTADPAFASYDADVVPAG